MTRIRAALLAVVGLVPGLVLVAPGAAARSVAPPAPASRGTTAPSGVIQAIRVEGNHRIRTAKILSYVLVHPGDPFDLGQIDRSLKTLYATGLFSDVTITRQGGTLVVHVAENPMVERVTFDGNHQLDDSELRSIVQLRPHAMFTVAAAEADRRRILEAYAKKGYYGTTVAPQIVRLPENRVDVVFEINDGAEALISRITFVGNHAFGEGRLSDVIDSREVRWWRMLSTSDQYSAQRLALDKWRLQRFYFSEGYADFRIVSATVELAPDRKSIFLTFTLHEGARYRVGKVTIRSDLAGLPLQALDGQLQLSSGDWYDGDAVEDSMKDLAKYMHDHGFGVVTVKPRFHRHPKTHTIDIDFQISYAVP